MKKILSAITALCLLLSLVATLASCAHECEFSTEWSKDENYHWHICTKDDECTEISDKANHTWGDGEITTKPSQETDGVKTFACTVCGQTRTEAVEFTGMTEEEWNKAFNVELFTNFAYKESATTESGGQSMESEVVYKFTDTRAHVKITVSGESESQFADSAEDAVRMRNQLINSLKAIAVYKNFDYDPETKTYSANKEIYISSLKATSYNVTLAFEDGKLSEMRYSAHFTQGGRRYTSHSTITIYDYDKVSF